MKSPITGKEMNLTNEIRSMDFRKERIGIIYHFYRCVDSKEQFTTTALDELNMNQVYNKYRDKFNLPFPDEISSIRKKYGLPASKMSAILGFGANSYRQYESGEVPSISNARLIQMVSDPMKFKDMVVLCDLLDDKAKEKLIQKAQVLIDKQHQNNLIFNLKDYLLGNHLADLFTGYRNPNFEKFTEMVVYFSDKVQPFKTKMNKLLFYADFQMFKQSCYSISGMRYQAIEMGPVPRNYQSIFELLDDDNQIDIAYIPFPQGQFGEQFKARKDRPFNSNLFSAQELVVLKKIAHTFKLTSTQEMIEISHLEEAWKRNIDFRSDINYDFAFLLQVDLSTSD